MSIELLFALSNLVWLIIMIVMNESWYRDCQRMNDEWMSIVDRLMEKIYIDEDLPEK